MSIYVTEDLVKEIYDIQDDAHSILPFIMVAEQLTNKIEAYILSKDEVVDTANITEIQRWLSAHFMTAQEKITKSEKVSDVGESYDLSTKVGLANSHFGQTAILLDSSGYLRKLDNGEMSSITVSLENW